MRIQVINGPNINMLGIREPDQYGTETYGELVKKIQDHCKEKNITVTFTQSNHEGVLVDALQSCYFNKVDAVILNPAAYTHYSIAIRDAVSILEVPVIEVHISDVLNREAYRKKNMISDSVTHTISGKGTNGYIDAIDYVMTLSNKENVEIAET